MSKRSIAGRTKLVESIIAEFHSLTNQAVVIIEDQQQADQLFSKIKEMLDQQKEKTSPHLPIGYRVRIARRTANKTSKESLRVLTTALYDALTIYNSEYFNEERNKAIYKQFMTIWTRAHNYCIKNDNYPEITWELLYQLSEALNYFSPPNQYFDRRNDRYGYWMK